MLRNILILLSFISAVRAIGELTFALIPRTISLSGTSQLDSLYVGDLILASLGYAVSFDSSWPGMKIENPLELGKTSIMVLYVNGIFNIPGIYEKSKTFPLMESDIEKSLDYLITQLPNGTVHDFNFCNHNEGVAAYQAYFRNLTMDAAFLPLENNNLDEYFHQKRFLEEISYIDSISQHLAELMKPSHVLIIRLSVLSVMNASRYTTLNEPRRRIESMIGKLRLAASNLHPSVLFMIATNKENTRPAIRSLRSGYMYYPFEDIGQDSNLPVIIQISVWLTLALTLTTVTASYYLATIDPGNDSIIYRMSPIDVTKKVN